MSENRAQALQVLMQEVEAEDPLDFGATPLDEAETRRLVALSMLKLRDDLAELSADERELVLMASAGHLVLENLLLHYERLTASGHGAEEAASALLSRLRNG